MQPQKIPHNHRSNSISCAKADICVIFIQCFSLFSPFTHNTITKMAKKTVVQEAFNLNIDEYREKVYGCWLGKNIGGTLGAPFEGGTELTDLKFYYQEMNGDPLPNDDLDLQLIWLCMVERYGLFNLNSRLFGDHWASHIIGPWNEYSVCHYNVRNGFYPPISGAINNDHWKNSNGAWIRSEIWACLCPGNPDAAIKYAYLDSSCDHANEGIYAEMYTAALESAAFVISDLRKLISIGLSKVPKNSYVAKYVKMVCDCYDKGIDWKKARQMVVDDNLKDLGWFMAPANVAFATLGLLYGEGDFGKTICTAVNCGDDTDCTGATAGAIMGIIYGRKAIPKKWSDPIGDKILTCAVNKFGLLQRFLPATVQELTERTIRVALDSMHSNLAFTPINDKPFAAPKDAVKRLSQTDMAEKIWKKNPYQMDYFLTNCMLRVIYENPIVEPGKPVRVRLEIRNPILSEGEFIFNWMMPEGWTVDKPQGRTSSKCWVYGYQEFVITPGEFTEAIEYVTLDVRIHDRNFPNYVSIPFELKGSIYYPKNYLESECDEYEEEAFRVRPLINKALGKNPQG